MPAAEHMPAAVAASALLHSACHNRMGTSAAVRVKDEGLTSMRDLRGCPCLAATAHASSSTTPSTLLRSDRRSCSNRHNHTVEASLIGVVMYLGALTTPIYCKG